MLFIQEINSSLFLLGSFYQIYNIILLFFRFCYVQILIYISWPPISKSNRFLFYFYFSIYFKSHSSSSQDSSKPRNDIKLSSFDFIFHFMLTLRIQIMFIKFLNQLISQHFCDIFMAWQVSLLKKMI